MAKWDHDDLRDKSDDLRARDASLVQSDPQYKLNLGQNPDAIKRLGDNASNRVPYKYAEDTILKEIRDYIDMTYSGHYVGEDNVQSLDLILATGHATGFNIGNVLKYGSRYGKKRGYNRDDLLKVVHYAIFELFNHQKNHMGESD